LGLTFDAASINYSPADQNRTDDRVGDTGLLIGYLESGKI
jgi:hypothetical protein